MGNCFSINQVVAQKFNLNPLQKHFENTKWHPVHPARPLTINNRIEPDKQSQSENGICDRTIVGKKGKVCIRAKWPIRPELIPVSVA